ncbi:MAG: PorP/SprF family type IX secretion system membrane protein [Prevotella sp.]|nr:PorP/SprF family type IX secretion system membrane protein [Prevotella sp.]
MHKRHLLLFVVLLALMPEARAQYDPSFSHYWAMETAFNPAAAGKDPKMNVYGAYNMTLTGFEHYPKTMYISADMPVRLLGAFHGVGVQVVNDEIGLFSHKKVNLQYAYKHRLLGGTVSIGLQGGLLSESFDGGEADLETGTDPAFTKSELTGTGFDLSAGLYYQHRNWYVGVSAQHLTGPTVELGETNELNISQSFYFTGGYNIRLRNPFLTIQTSVLGRTDGVAYRGDVTARLKYTHEKKIMYAGLSYSPTNSVSVLVGGHFHGIMIGYCYEAYTTAISLGNGGHELFVGYQTDVNFSKKGRNRHQSVRIL